MCLLGEDQAALAGGAQGVDGAFVVDAQCALRAQQLTAADRCRCRGWRLCVGDGGCGCFGRGHDGKPAYINNENDSQYISDIDAGQPSSAIDRLAPVFLNYYLKQLVMIIFG
jgi:hypothetical protein